MTDPIADMLIRIKNALLARKDDVAMPHSRMKESLATILKTNGYIKDFSIKKDGARVTLLIELKYVGRVPAITDVKRISKPGCRLYASTHEIPRSLGGYGITIMSTPKGVVTDKEARKAHVGGEILCQVW